LSRADAIEQSQKIVDAGFFNTDFATDLVAVASGTDELLVFVGDGSDDLPTPARYAKGANEPIVARIADVIGSPIPRCRCRPR
jgi:hypothetical protein